MDDGGNPDYTSPQPLTINGNGFTVNMADSGAFLNLFTAGAVVVTTSPSPTETRTATAARSTSSTSNTTLNNVHFIENQSSDDGGAIDMDGDNDALVVNGGSFEGNVASDDAGAITRTTTATALSRSTGPRSSGTAPKRAMPVRSSSRQTAGS